MADDTRKKPATSPERTRRLRARLALLTAFLDQHERIFNVLNTTVTAIFTIILATSTVFLWRNTKDLRDFAQEQSADMKASIKEAALSARAMQEVAASLAASAKSSDQNLALYKDANVRQMRAYVTVGLGAVIRQDEQTKYRFEVRMTVQNVGNTPAYKVAAVAHSAILDFPLSNDFSFSVLDEISSSANVIGQHQTFIVTGIADRIYSDEDVNEAENGTKKRLYVYGAIVYEDAFGVKRHTNFCQAILFLKEGKFMSQNTTKYNDAD
jgi:hypothetical protein